MDVHSLELLEFGRIRDWVRSEARTAIGKERCAALAPLSDHAKLSLDLKRVSEMMDALGSRMPPPLEGITDVRGEVKRAEIGVLLDVSSILAISDVCEATERLIGYRQRIAANHPTIAELLQPIQDLTYITRLIRGVIDDRSRVKDSASRELTEVRQQLAVFDEKIQNEFRRLLRSAEIRKSLRYPQPTMCGDHHVLAVAINYRHMVPGIVHRTSPTGETIFVEPAKIAQISADVIHLKNVEEREVRRVLRQLTSSIGQDAKRIQATLGIVAEVDFVASKGRFGLKHNMHVAHLSTEAMLRLQDARHPILLELASEKAAASKRNEAEKPPVSKPSESKPVTSTDATNSPEDSSPATTNEPVVPINVQLGYDYDLLVITGPNTGGKTVALKTVGLLSAMTMAGLPISAKPGSVVPIWSNILVDIGDEQSIEQSLSTFSGHMTRIAQILSQCDERSLVLLDELGAGTDPAEGSALGRAILDELGSRKCRGLVSTHLGDLKTYAFNRDRVENAAVEFDVKTLRPTYRLMVGQVGQSCALIIARRLKLPGSVLKRAGKYLKRKRGRGTQDLLDLQKLRAETEQARQEALNAKALADAEAAALQRQAAQMVQETSVQQQLQQARETLRPGDEVRVPKFDKLGSVKRVDTRRRLVTVLVGKVEWEVKLDEVIPNLMAQSPASTPKK